ncbi:MAG: type sorting protein [Flaviaesturariibacter sp.]|nr:type sorting protein [Flaviaesturariibacter sp.]
MEALQKQLETDPVFRANYEKAQRDYERSLQSGSSARTQRMSSLTGPVTIPVVVHIVLPNPNIVTDADVKYFIDRLNLDFSGLNPDSTNVGTFQSVRGHSLLRFTLAKRDPNGNLTNGIERKVGAGTINGGEPQPIKSAANGLAPWDFTQYYNLWVGVGSGGLLGIAPTIGVGTAANDGVCVDYSAFANNSCYSIPQFNLARTAVHEIGHNFGLYHITGDASCGVDFKQLATAPAMILPDALLAPADDTPTQTALTSGCPAVGTLNGCSPSVPKMFQNYMDYTDDACYSMFTKGQVLRMEYVLENFRPGYLTTQGHIPPASAVSLDALPFESVAPGGYELNGCTITNYGSSLSCPGAYTPKFRIRNNGQTTLTSVVAGYRLNNGAAVSQTFAVNLPNGASTVVSFAATNSLVVGTNTFRYFTSAPNAGVDQVPSNDSLTATLTVLTAAAIPVSETFEGAFPGNWTIFNPNGNVTWVRSTPGNASPNALFINNYDFQLPGQIDEFRSQALTVTPGDSVIINFDLAHKNYPSTTFVDTLTVLVSSDCGATYTAVYKKWGANLATAGSSTASYLNPAAADWVTQRIGLGGATLASGQITIAIRNTNGYGNNIFIDNINIAKKADLDMKVAAILSPNPAECVTTITPRVTVTNVGAQTVNSFKVGYRYGTGPILEKPFTITLASGASTTVILDPNTTPLTSGPQTITAWTSAPNGLTDLQQGNDTLRKNFTVRAILSVPVVEDFEGSFPPANWTISNPNNNITWVQKSPGRNSSFSAFFDNYSTDMTGQIDDMRMPPVNVATRDSVIFSFDVAHKDYPGSADHLMILASSDCGNTFTTVYDKAGPTLATAGSSTAAYNRPAPADWRRERIALGGSILSSGNLIFYIRNVDDFGNNIFVDNVNVDAVSKRDIQLVSINTPPSFACAAAITPSVTIRNSGIETITGFKVAYSVDFGTPTTTTVTSINLVRNATMNVNLNAGSLGTAGMHNIRVYSFEPVSNSGTGDMFTGNDTLVKSVALTGTTPANLYEDFSNAGFPPANWGLVNADIRTTWARSSAGFGNPGSAFLNSFSYPGSSNRDDLVTPVVTFSGIDSLHLTFDVAAGSKSYPGTTAIPVDTLEVLVTTNCGASYQTVYKKWGQDLQTAEANVNPNFPQGNSFEPQNNEQWRRESVDLGAFTGSPSVQVVFRATTNNGNNIYLDNVYVNARTLPAQLKQRGFMVLPNPFAGQFNIWHYQTPTTLKYVNVYDSKGQLVWRRSFSNNTEKVISVDLSSQPAGVYMVNIGYEDEYRNVSERVIKR